MAPSQARYAHLLTEYATISPRERAGVLRPDRTLDWDRVERVLRADAEWTQAGAREVAWLARNYGYFILENAAALARALRIEDGASGM